jgi:hypothetical protein
MSAYVLSDKHFTVISNYVCLIKDNISIIDFANKLKSINIKSVNYKYKENARITKCKLDNPKMEYSKYDIIRLIQCWDYQSCENIIDIDFNLMQCFLYSLFNNDEIQNARNNSTIWSI